jgi:DNA-binding phage protein
VEASVKPAVDGRKKVMGSGRRPVVAPEPREAPEALYKALTPDGDPKLSTFFSVLKALGMKVTARAA